MNSVDVLSQLLLHQHLVIVPEVEDLEVRHEDEAGAKDEASDHGEEEFVDVLRMFSSSF